MKAPASAHSVRCCARTQKKTGYEIFDEYADDGWSGTNFDRPAWKRLLRDIENKKVNLVITKDLSRLGRDYIAAGQFTEIYFPSKGVRYIAVNDGYDSDSPCTDIAPFKNVINEMYARDTSKKIRSAFRTKMEEGAFIGNFAPYGYIKDPEDKNRLLIDNCVAPIVREIFRMAQDGVSPSKIAGALNLHGITTPAVYRCRRRLFMPSDDYYTHKQWTSSMICKILRNIVYLGHIAQGKTTKVSFKSPITLQNPRDEWIIAENMHEALVSQETFDTVRKRSVSRRQPPKTDFTNVFSGVAICADCGRSMSTTGTRRKGSVYNLVCGGYTSAVATASAPITSSTMKYSMMWCSARSDGCSRRPLRTGKRSSKRLLKEAAEEKPEVTGAVTALKTREKELDRIIERLYEDTIAGRLDDARFNKLLAAYETEQKDISARLTSHVNPEEPAAIETERDAYREFTNLLNDLTEVTELTPDLLHKLIDRIEVCQGSFDKGRRGGRKRQTIRIYYKFNGQ